MKSISTIMEVSKIREADKNVHAKENKKSETFKGLVDSIRKVGIIHRIVLRQVGDDMVVVDGHRRLAAAKEAGMKEVPVEILDVAVGDNDALAMTLAANIQRLENNPVLEAMAIDRMLRQDMSKVEIAAALGKDLAYIMRRARLINLSARWQEFAHDHKCTVDLLEKVAAFEKSVQEQVAEECDIDNSDCEDETYAWSDFERSFLNSTRKLGKAIFDKTECANCEYNTACHAFLFDWMASEEEEAVCENQGCFARKHNETVDRKIEALKKKKRVSVIEVADKWKIPNYWSVTQQRKGDNVQPYVYMSNELKELVWGPVPLKRGDKDPEVTAKEREEKKRRKMVKSARDKVRYALVNKLEDEDSFVGSELFVRLAKRRFRREIEGYITDSLVDDYFRECQECETIDEAEKIEYLKELGIEADS